MPLISNGLILNLDSGDLLSFPGPTEFIIQANVSTPQGVITAQHIHRYIPGPPPPPLLGSTTTTSTSTSTSTSTTTSTSTSTSTSTTTERIPTSTTSTTTRAPTVVIQFINEVTKLEYGGSPVFAPEGDVVRIHLTNVTGVPIGYTIPYTITGNVSAADINNAAMSGSFSQTGSNWLPIYIGGNRQYYDANLTITINEDLTSETTEHFTLNLGGVFSGVSKTLRVSDTSRNTGNIIINDYAGSAITVGDGTDSQPYQLNEGNVFLMSLRTTGVAASTSIPYTITGISADDVNVALTGTFVQTLQSGIYYYSAVVPVEIIDDWSIDEGYEYLKITVDSGPFDIMPSANIRIYDIPRYRIAPSVTTINEGEIISFNIETNGLAPGTTLYYDVSGIDIIDLNFGLYGSFKATSLTGSDPVYGVAASIYGEIVNVFYTRLLGRYPESIAAVDFRVNSLLSNSVTLEDMYMDFYNSAEAISYRTNPFSGTTTVGLDGNAVVTGNVVLDYRKETTNTAVFNVRASSGGDIKATTSVTINDTSVSFAGLFALPNPLQDGTPHTVTFINIDNLFAGVTFDIGVLPPTTNSPQAALSAFVVTPPTFVMGSANTFIHTFTISTPLNTTVTPTGEYFRLSANIGSSIYTATADILLIPAPVPTTTIPPGPAPQGPAAMAGIAGEGGAGGGGSLGGNETGGGGGGVGIYGQSTSGAAGGCVWPDCPGSVPGGAGGSGGVTGASGTGSGPSGNGGDYGGGGGGADISGGARTGGRGANGAVRIIWGSGRSFPSTNVGSSPGTEAIFTNPGNNSWTVPAGVSSVCVVLVGGGGAGAGYSGQPTEGGHGEGGGGGALAWKNNISVTQGDIHAIVVGAGGIGTMNGHNSYADGTASTAFGVTAGGGLGGMQVNPAYNLTGRPGKPQGGSFSGAQGGGYGGYGGTGDNTTVYDVGGGGGGAGGYSGNGGKGGSNYAGS